ncbi:phage holin family protein [Undibacterium sp. Ji42W]|uniref:phage holin family protein n=1 Tax=Undibacterium sp. Ji42W TaxID=3413039 RepID=UPI003BF32956
MFETIDKARQLAVIGLDRIVDYLELLRIEIDIQRHDVATRLINLVASMLFILMAGIFLGFAIIVTYWESDYRIIAAWCVAGFYILLALVTFWKANKHSPAPPMFATLKQEMQDDMKMLKDLL